MRRLAPTILLALGLAGSATAHHNGAPDVDHYVQRDGTGQLIANPGGHQVTWQRCRPGEACETLPHTDQLLDVGDEPVGTTFVATQDGVSTRSQPWQGLLRTTSPPHLQGAPKVGELVRPVAATWEGGWGRERDWLQLQACRTPEGEGCVVIIDEIKYGQCEPGGGRYVPASVVGRWLLVADVRIDRDQPFTSEGYSAPEGIEPQLATGPGVAVAAFGPVRAGRAHPSGCGNAEPSVTLVSSPLPDPTLAWARCPFGCRLTWSLRQGRRRIAGRRVLEEREGVELRLSRRQARGLRPGAARLRVHANGRLVADRRVRLRAPG